MFMNSSLFFREQQNNPNIIIHVCQIYQTPTFMGYKVDIRITYHKMTAISLYAVYMINRKKSDEFINISKFNDLIYKSCLPYFKDYANQVLLRSNMAFSINVCIFLMLF
jgi:hypothetical protein